MQARALVSSAVGYHWLEAVVSYGRNTQLFVRKLPVSPMESVRHLRKIQNFIENALADLGIEETFRVADQNGCTRIVPFLSLVLNHGIRTEIRNGSTALPDYTKNNGPGGRF